MDPALVATSGSDEVQHFSSGATKFLPIVALGALFVIAFVAPWISYGDSAIRLSLGGKVSVGDAMSVVAHSQVWGLVFAGVCIAFAIWIAVQPTADDVGGVTFLAGGALFILVLATWMGRSIWSDIPLDDPHMAWGYWVSLALTIGLVVVSAVLIAAASDD